VDGQVNAVVFDGGRVFVGGSFSTAGGSPANNIALYWYDVPPVAVNDPSYTATEDTQLDIFVDNSNGKGFGVLKNDTDADTLPPLRTAKKTSDPSKGTVT